MFSRENLYDSLTWLNLGYIKDPVMVKEARVHGQAGEVGVFAGLEPASEVPRLGLA